MKRYILYIISLIIVFSCAKDIIDLTGSIEGVVKDNATSMPLQGVSITLSPSGKSVTTGSDGRYSFPELDAQNYSIEFSKVGYEANKKEVTVLAGRPICVDVMLNKITNALNVNPETLNFGDLETSKTLFISCLEQLGNIRYTVKTDAQWISLSKSEGNATSAGDKITVVIDRSKLSIGNYEKNITISSIYGDKIIPVIVSQVEHDIATLITDTPEDITETSLTIKGTIVKTGGLKITSYGHCWAETEQPTIDNNKNNLGDTESIGDFTSTLTNLIAGKTYYIRAYAVNSKGIAYSKPVSVTMPYIEKAMVATLSISNLAKDSVVLNGEINSDGNGNIKECGFYWGITDKTEYRVKADSAIDGKFSYTLKPLESETAYYYKAYAINEKGESSGEIKTFTSFDKNYIEGDESIVYPWDGSVASSFAGGSGTFVDPYIIKSSAQLAYLATCGKQNAYYKLINNLDLNNKPWKPIDFNGNFDGNGKTISNLYVARKQDNAGLFGVASGRICNLTINNAVINLPTQKNIGVFSGSTDGCVFENCHAELDDSNIIGDKNIGGLVGYVKDGNDATPFKNCSVISEKNDPVIKGNENIGGICGTLTNSYMEYKSSAISNCHVKASIMGELYIGGLFGDMGSRYISVENSSYSGNLIGREYVGGIIGCVNSNVSLKSLKTNVKITAEGVQGGILGFFTGNTYGSGFGISLVSCYAIADFVNSSSISGGFIGRLGYGSKANLYCCYSLITPTKNISGFVGSIYDQYYSKYFTYDCATSSSIGISSGENSIADCSNNELIEHLQYSASEYLSNWNFNNTWIWTGVIDGVTKNVICPRLSWE